MCGICGFIDYSSFTHNDTLANMVKSLNHRGPDDSGVEVFTTYCAAVGLGHSRLSILDITSAGHQPMHYKSLSIVLNGEIYNFKELRNELRKSGHTFNSESDTEVVLHAFSEWGTSCITRFNGMFAFVIIDRNKEELIIVRDRAGVKPLFYYWFDGLFMFASEPKAFHYHPGFVKELNLNTVPLFMDFGYIPSPYCIYRYCSKLNPGHILTFDINKRKIEITKYWDVKDYYRKTKLNISYSEAKDETEKLLNSAFEYRMVSDVPVGVFLSGGYDSTAVASILQSQRTSKLKTFTIGFEEHINEAPFAKRISGHIGTEHTEYYCKEMEAKEIIPILPFYYDEPFADSSAIPTILVSRLAKESVSVALSADAGDEIFAGYISYSTFMKNLCLINKIPTFLRNIVSVLSELGSHILPYSLLNHKLAVLSDILKAKEKQIPQVLLRNYFILDKNSRRDLFCFKEIPLDTIYNEKYSDFKDNLSIALAIDYVMYLQNDILAKVDRATMSTSLEGREPFLDHRIIEFVAQLPSNFKYGITQKRILKDIVHKFVPEQLLNPRKTGFSIPIYNWLKEDLYYLLEENLNSENIAKTGIFNPSRVNELTNKFLKGHLIDPLIIWKFLQFQLWYNTWMK